MSNVPTLLIGLGGCGSEIVNMIYGWIPEDRRDRIAIHALDTDVNSIGKLQYLQGKVTQTSTKKLVGHVAGDEAVKAWFPENPQLMGKPLIDGAGQIRSVSRLAFRSAIEDGKLNNLLNEINSVFPVTGDGLTYNVRVMIVSSLAGGTGSGIFLQVAMYLREALEQRFGQMNVLIRGAFLLPDIFASTGILHETEWDNVRSNGYASLKELDAITQNAGGYLQNNVGTTIELEYKPNQVDMFGRTSHAITSRQLPYNFCFLYDYENLNNEHLMSKANYMEQVAKTVYLQLFSPISGAHFSQEDNQILSLIGAQGRNRYCGAGVASLIYPYEDIVEYCALRWAVNGLDTSWLILDKLYDENYKQYEANIGKGLPVVKPDRGELYMKHAENMAQDNSNNPFFKQVVKQVKLEDEKGKPVEYKAKLFINAIEEQIEITLNSDSGLGEVESECKADEVKLKMRDRAVKEVTRVEDALAYYLELVSKTVYDYKTFIVHQVVTQDYDTESCVQGQDYRLNTWLLLKPEPVHPIGVRFIFCQILSELRKKTSELSAKCQNYSNQIKKYDEAYNLNDKEERVMTAFDRVREAARQNRVRALVNNQLKDFADEYLEKSSRQLTAINEYKKARLTEMVFSDVMDAIQQMLKDLERFFANLKEVRTNLDNEQKNRATKHEKKDDPTKNYVLGNSIMKKRLWEDIRHRVDSDFLPSDISAQVYLSHYRQYCARKNNEGRVEIKVEEMYRNNVVAYCRNQLKNKWRDRLELDIVAALRKEAELLQAIIQEESKSPVSQYIDPEAHIDKRISTLMNLSCPFIPKINGSRELLFWGIHPDSSSALNGVQMQKLFAGKEMVDKAFSMFEVLCYRAHYGLFAQDFPKFSSGRASDSFNQEPGTYYKAYRLRINRLNSGEPTVTPHLDKRWHLPAYMPDLNTEQVELDRERIDRALLLGLIHGWLQAVNDEGSTVYQYNARNSSSLITVAGRRVSSHTYQLHNALQHNPAIFESILERAREVHEHERQENMDIEFHSFIKGAANLKIYNKPVKNILDVALAYPLDLPGDSTLQGKCGKLREQLLDVIAVYFKDVYGAHRKPTACKAAAGFIRKLWEESKIQQEMDKDSTMYVSWENAIANKVNELLQSVY